MHAAFDNTEAWSPMYQRNNKRTGLKNVRCFPYCSEQHIEKGFCGRPVILRVARSHREQSGSQPIFSWGEFRRVDDPREVDIGTFVTGDDIRARTKDPKGAKADSLNAPYFEGIVEGGEKSRASQLVKFVFNQRKKGWNYAWQASKHTAKARHAFFAYLFTEEAQDMYKCVGVYVSPTFILYCRKRKPEMSLSSGRGGEGMMDDDDDDDDEEEEQVPARKSKRSPKVNASATKKRRHVLSSAGGFNAAASDSMTSLPIFPEPSTTSDFWNAHLNLAQEDSQPRKRNSHLAPIVSPAKLPPPPAASNGLPTTMSFTSVGGLTPMTAMFLQTFADEPAGPLTNSRTSNTGTPSSFSGDDDELDFDAASQLDQAVVNRVGAVMDRLHAVLTADGTADALGLPQFALDWFINDLEEFADFGGQQGGTEPATTTTTPRVLPNTNSMLSINGALVEPLEWGEATSRSASNVVGSVQDNMMIGELSNYLLEESSLTASIRQIIAQAEEGKLSQEARLRSFINVFQNELSTFLAKRGYTERDLDEALSATAITSTSSSSNGAATLKTIDKHVQQVVENQKRLSDAMKNAPRSWLRAVSVRPEVDLNGHWRLDDTLLNAFDECRAKRGVPYMMRRLLKYMETKVIITHTHERVVIGLKSKLFASTEVVYELDGKDRVWDVAPPVPWPSRLVETCRAWIDGNTLRYCHTYNGVCRTDRIVRKNASGDRLEMDVFFQELVGEDQWHTVIFRRGYALRITSVDW